MRRAVWLIITLLTGSPLMNDELVLLPCMAAAAVIAAVGVLKLRKSFRG